MSSSKKKARITDKRPRQGLAKRLNDIRLDIKNDGLNAITQEEAAEKLSLLLYSNSQIISSKRISDWEGGLKEPNTSEIVGLAEIFDTTCDYLLTGVEHEHVDASRRYGLSNEALLTLEDLNSNMDWDLYIPENGHTLAIKPIEFINALLTASTIRDIAVNTIRLSYDLDLSYSLEMALEKLQTTRKVSDIFSQDYRDGKTIKEIFDTNPSYKNKRLVDFRDYFLSKEYDLNKKWSALMDEIRSSAFLIEKGIIHSKTLNRSWAGLPDTPVEGGNSDDNQEK